MDGLRCSWLVLVVWTVWGTPVGTEEQREKDEDMKVWESMIENNKITIRQEVIGQFGRVTVLDILDKSLRIARVDQSFIGGIWLPSQQCTTEDSHCHGNTAAEQLEHPFNFVDLCLFSSFILSSTVRFAKEEIGAVLQIGLGVGSNAMIMQQQGNIENLDIVEIDANIVSIATQYFYFSNSKGSVTIRDGREFLFDCKAHSYDVIFHDVYTAGTSTKHLMTLEVFQQISEVLTPDGILVFTFVCSVDPPFINAPLSILSTLKMTFNYIRVFYDGGVQQSEGKVNSLVYFCSNVPIHFKIPNPPKIPLSHTELNFLDWEIWRDQKEYQNIAPITDLHNPLDTWQSPIGALLYQQMLSLLVQ